MSFKPLYDEKDWMVVGSGPSAPRYAREVLAKYPDIRTACVNGSYGVLPEGVYPHTYAVFEGAAVGKYGEIMLSMNARGAQTMGRRIVAKQVGKLDTEIDVGWGTDGGYDKDRIVQQLGGAMVSGGVELLHAVAHKFRPRVIRVVGFDGYRPDGLHADSAGSAPERSEQWCKTANASMSAHIAAITQAYPKVKFVFYGPCIHRNGWLGEFVE